MPNPLFFRLFPPRPSAPSLVLKHLLVVVANGVPSFPQHLGTVRSSSAPRSGRRHIAVGASKRRPTFSFPSYCLHHSRFALQPATGSFSCRTSSDSFSLPPCLSLSLSLACWCVSPLIAMDSVWMDFKMAICFAFAILVTRFVLHVFVYQVKFRLLGVLFVEILLQMQLSTIFLLIVYLGRREIPRGDVIPGAGFCFRIRNFLLYFSFLNLLGMELILSFTDVGLF